MTEEIYNGLAFVSFEDEGGPASLELIDVSLRRSGILTYELFSAKQRKGRRVLVTPVNGLTFQGNVIEQQSGMTRFISRSSRVRHPTQAKPGNQWSENQ